MEVGKIYTFRGYRQSDGTLQKGEEDHEEFNKPIICLALAEPISSMSLYEFPHSGRKAHLFPFEVGELPSKPLEDWL